MYKILSGSFIETKIYPKCMQLILSHFISSNGLGFLKSDAQAKTLECDVILYAVMKQRG